MGMIVANPIYDSVFRVLMADLEVAQGILSALIGMRVIELRMAQQEYVHKNPESGELAGMRLDFNAVVETEERGQFNVIIELQKAKVGSNALRFRRYLANQYQSKSEIHSADGSDSLSVSLPIISIYLLGYGLDEDLPIATHVAREYRNAVTGKALKPALQICQEFIELLTHDAYFIQIPKIIGKQGTELERVLSVFDQHRKLADDDHRLEIELDSDHTDPLISKIYRILNEIQENPEIEAAMKLEDLFLEEQQDAIATERKLRKETEAKLEEETQKRQEESRKRQEESQKRQEAEAEIKRLKKLLGEED